MLQCYCTARKSLPSAAPAAIPASFRPPCKGWIRTAVPVPAIWIAGTSTGNGRRPTEFKQEMKHIVLAEDFLDNNFLSNDARIPVTLLETNACSTLATNAIEDNIWDNFSSRSYKDLPSVGTITVHHPITGEPRPIRCRQEAGVTHVSPASSVCGRRRHSSSTTAWASSIQVRAWKPE